MRFFSKIAVLMTLVVALCWSDLATAEGLLRDKLRERLAARQEQPLSQLQEPEGGLDTHRVNPANLPANTKILRDQKYGRDQLQALDVYLPPEPHDLPIIVMVHGGGWKRGDKYMAGVVENKVKYWLPKGFIFVSVNYRLHPEVKITDEADDVASALAYVQGKAASWGGNAENIVMMGHSAGAHLVAYLSANPELATRNGAKPWKGTIPLDSAMMDAVGQMTDKPYKLLSKKIYDEVLGTDKDYWELVSPYHQLTSAAIPFYIVCSSKRKDACPQAYDFKAKAQKLGVKVEVLEEYLSHAEVNKNLGLPGNYSIAVDRAIARMLSGTY